MNIYKILTVLATIAGAATISSCYPCTGEERPAPLRPLPHFNDVPTPAADQTAVDYAK